MPRVASNGIEIEYETFGDAADPPLVLIIGLGSQMVSWPDGFCALLVARGFYVIRFDNRDVGKSTWIETPELELMAAIGAALGGDGSQAPYVLSDLADDLVGLLDALGIESAHLVGASMGGMIAQTVAIEHPRRARSLTSIMSSTGEPGVGSPDPEVLPILLTPRPSDPEAWVTSGIEVWRTIWSPDHFDEAEARARCEREAARGINPDGAARQFLAILASGSRAKGLAEVDLPALVVHGRQDRLVGFDGGQRTAELVAGADFLAIDDMAHDLPRAHWVRIADAIAAVADRSQD